MKQVAFTNNKKHIVYVGPKSVPPGQTRMVDESMLPDAHKLGEKSAEEPARDPLLDILDLSVPKAAEKLPGLSGDELDIIEQAERDGNTRKSLMKAITEERLRRASAADTGDGPDASTDEIDPDASEE